MRIRLGWFDERLSERIAAIAAGRLAPAVARDAATIMVVRPAPDRPADRSADGSADSEVEVLMLRRPAAMAFAPGAYVFPGGSVDAADSDPEIGWSGPDPAEFGEGGTVLVQGRVGHRGRAVRTAREEDARLFEGLPHRRADEGARVGRRAPEPLAELRRIGS